MELLPVGCFQIAITSDHHICSIDFTPVDPLARAHDEHKKTLREATPREIQN